MLLHWYQKGKVRPVLKTNNLKYASKFAGLVVWHEGGQGRLDVVFVDTDQGKKSKKRVSKKKIIDQGTVHILEHRLLRPLKRYIPEASNKPLDALCAAAVEQTVIYSSKEASHSPIDHDILLFATRQAIKIAACVTK